jgi:hypothetical protein
VHAEVLVLDVDLAGPREGRFEDVEDVTHVRGRALVGEAEHLVDDPVVRHAEPEGQPAAAHRLHRQCLLHEGDGMTGLHRHDRGADLDPGGLGPDQGRGGERIELVGDLGDPDRRQPGLLGPHRVAAHAIDLRPVPTPLGPDHHADAHRSSACRALLCCLGENLLLRIL